MPAKTRLAQLVSRREGFGIAGATWADLERQLWLYGNRGLTLREMAEIYWPRNENKTDSCLNFICQALGMNAGDYVVAALSVPAVGGDEGTT